MPDGLCASVEWSSHCSELTGICTTGGENEGCERTGDSCSPCFRGFFGPGMILDATSPVATDAVSDDLNTHFKQALLIGDQVGYLERFGVESHDSILLLNGRVATPQAVEHIVNRKHKEEPVAMTIWSASAKEIRTIQVL